MYLCRFYVQYEENAPNYFYGSRFVKNMRGAKQTKEYKRMKYDFENDRFYSITASFEDENF